MSKNKIDFKKLDNIEIDGVDYSDAPEFCDAYISYAEIDGRELTDEELDEVNENSSFVYETVINRIY